MAPLYFDRNVARRVGQLLEGDGHDVLASHDVDSERLPDDVLLLTAVRLNRMFIKHNRNDFKMLHDAWVTWPAAFGLALPAHPGVLVLNSAPPETLAQAIAGFLNRARAHELPDAIFWWRHREGWYRSTGGGPWEPYQPTADADRE